MAENLNTAPIAIYLIDWASPLLLAEDWPRYEAEMARRAAALKNSK